MRSAPDYMHSCMKIGEKQLAHLAAVIEAGGVSEGASLLGLSQPALSRSLANLEARVGVPLFEAGRRPLRPTSFGRMLGVQGRSVLAASQRAGELAEAWKRGDAGAVRIGGVPFFLDAMISTMLAGWSVRRPDLRIVQSYGYFADLRDGLLEGRLDLAVCPVGAGGPGDALRFAELLPAQNVVACRVGHPLIRRPPRSGAELAEWPWIKPSPGSPLLGDLEGMRAALGIGDLRATYEGGSLAAVLNWLEETDALTILPHSVVFAIRTKRQVAALPFDLPQQPNRVLGILSAAAVEPTPAAADVIAHLGRRFGDMRHMIARHEAVVIWRN